MSPTGHFIPPLLVFSPPTQKKKGERKKRKETRNDERHTAWINPHLPSLGVDTVRIFSSGFFISSNIQSQQKKIMLS
jgi:hypothetical protein